MPKNLKKCLGGDHNISTSDFLNKKFEGLPCIEYCCVCCPKKNESPCPKEIKYPYKWN